MRSKCHTTSNTLRQSLISSHRIKRMTQFILLALAADSGLIFVELAAGLDPLEDFSRNPLVYSYFFCFTIVAFGVFGFVIGSREELLKKMSLTDSLTGLLNKQYLWNRINEEFASAKRYKTPLSLIIFDIDFFKKVNDNFGHPTGDKTLQVFARVLQTQIRKGDIATRVGGEEFVVLLPHTPIEMAAGIAERTRNLIKQEQIKTDAGNKFNITVSAGVVCTTDYIDHNAEAIYELADKALYKAKEHGRDLVMVAGH